MDALFNRSDFNKQDKEFRIGAIVSDGMWWSIEKWAKQSKVSEEELRTWINEHLMTGELIQSETGARSYRFPLTSIQEWYKKYGITLGVQLVDFLFPPRIWDGMTEAEGFEKAPLREVGMVKFTCAPYVAAEVKNRLKGIARIRESNPGEYRAYALSSAYVKSIIQDVFSDKSSSEIGKVHSRISSRRREMVDFTPEFGRGLILFYQEFGKTLVKGSMDTIKIYLPDPEDQKSQITYWVILAIEKFDEASSVPFSGYLNVMIKHRPYDLPYDHLGKELSVFQRERSRAVKRLKATVADESPVFTNEELSKEMGIPVSTFNDLEAKHRAWIGTKTATTLTWTESSDEKLTKESVTNTFNVRPSNDIELAHRLSIAITMAALRTGLHQDALALISQIDATELDISKIENVNPEFIKALGEVLGVGGY